MMTILAKVRHQLHKSRRLFVGATLIKIIVTLSLLGSGCTDMIRDRFAKARLPDYELMKAGEINIVLCGTNAPLPNPKRAEACTAVITEDEVLFFDMGNRAVSRIQDLKLPFDRFENVFITHLHDDHMAGVGELINRSWIFGRKNTPQVYGPVGTHKLVQGINLQYEADRNYREAHHFKQQQGIYTMDQQYAVPESNEITFTNDSELVKVYQNKSGLVVSAFLVQHQPIDPAIAYRIDYKGRVIVISGDTDVSENLILHSQNADVLIHEVMNKKAMGFMAENAKNLEDPHNPERGKRLGFMMADTLDYHIDVADLGKSANKANVNTLMLTHLVPGLSNSSLVNYAMFKRPIAKHFDGEIIVGEDGTKLTLTF